MNRVILMGNLTQTPILKQSEKTKFAKCVIAVDKNQDLTNFFKIVAFKNQADYLTAYGEKGSRVLIEGVLSSYKWEDDKGNSQYGVEILVDRVWVLDRKDNKPAKQVDPLVNANSAKDWEISKVADDDLPF
jgi:single-strand DNA-binding protein